MPNITKKYFHITPVYHVVVLRTKVDHLTQHYHQLVPENPNIFT
jgi:hypothetical protein